MKIYYGHRNEYFKDGKWWQELKDDIKPTTEVDSYEEGLKWLDKRINDSGFISYYKNVNIDNHHEWVEIDFGSYSTFCLFYDLSNEDWMKLYGNEVVDEKRHKTIASKLAEKLGNKPTAHSSMADYVD